MSKLPDDAFSLYVGMGDSRSYRAVAEAFGVSERTVAQRASKDGWQARLEAVQAKARETADSAVAADVEAERAACVRRRRELRQALDDVATPQRMKAVLAALMKEAVERGDVSAARVLIDRVFGKPRTEALVGAAAGVPEMLETATDVKVAVAAVLAAVAEGRLTPEDGQKLGALVEAARKVIETEELEERISELERQQKDDGRRR